MTATPDIGGEERKAGLPDWLAKRPQMNPRLVVVEGEATRDEIQIKLPMTIGRVPGNTLVISHPLVSRKHCEIFRRDDWLWIKDFGSVNGTFIAEKRVDGEGLIRPGDRLTIGPLTFVALYQQSQLTALRDISDLPDEDAKAHEDTVHQDESAKPVESSSKSDDEDSLEEGSASALDLNRILRDNSDSDIQLIHNKGKSPAEAVKPPTEAPQDVGNSVRINESGPDTEYFEESDDNILALELNLMPKRSVISSERGLNDAGRTMVSGSLQLPIGPVELEHKLGGESQNLSESAITPAPTKEDKQAADISLYRLLQQVDQMQTVISERYQNTSVLVDMFSRLQQRQLDLLHEEMDRMKELSHMIRVALVNRIPTLQSVPEMPDAPAPPPLPDVESGIPNEEIANWNLAETEVALRQRLIEEQESRRAYWEQIRVFFQNHQPF